VPTSHPSGPGKPSVRESSGGVIWVGSMYRREGRRDEQTAVNMVAGWASPVIATKTMMELQMVMAGTKRKSSTIDERNASCVFKNLHWRSRSTLTRSANLSSVGERSQ